MTKKVIIMGAAGRDFHNFLTCYKDNAKYKVIGFTAAQIPLIADRKFPAELAGRLYPSGIEIFHEEKLLEGMLLAMIVHTIFNSFLELGQILLIFPFLFVLFILILNLLHRKSTHIRRGLWVQHTAIGK